MSKESKSIYRIICDEVSYPYSTKQPLVLYVINTFTDNSYYKRYIIHDNGETLKYLRGKSLDINNLIYYEKFFDLRTESTFKTHKGKLYTTTNLAEDFILEILYIKNSVENIITMANNIDYIYNNIPKELFKNVKAFEKHLYSTNDIKNELTFYTTIFYDKDDNAYKLGVRFYNFFHDDNYKLKIPKIYRNTSVKVIKDDELSYEWY